MHHKLITCSAAALLASAVAFSAVPAAVATSSKTTAVTVRIEGLHKTILASGTYTVPKTGYITHDGAPTGKCPADSAAGALRAATNGNWSGSWSASYDDYEVSTIDRVTENYESSGAYWSFYVNNVAAATGICGATPLKPGEQIMFAAIPDSATGYALAIKAPASATAGHEFKIKVVYYNAKGAAVPLADAVVKASGGSAKTNKFGTAEVVVHRPGYVSLNVSATGYVRAATVTVLVKQ
jgi:hypothetical protein